MNTIDNTKSLSILHIDSDMLMRKILKRTLQTSTIRIDSAANGREAFSLLQKQNYSYDVVITEMYMHYANGYEIVNSVLQNAPQTVVIITSTMSYLHLQEGMTIARENYFKKPLMMGRLANRIQCITQEDGIEISKIQPKKELQDSTLMIQQQHHITTNTPTETVAAIAIPISQNSDFTPVIHSYNTELHELSTEEIDNDPQDDTFSPSIPYQLETATTNMRWW